MLAAGVHPKIVSGALGHSTVAIALDIYSHVVPGLQEAAANRGKLSGTGASKYQLRLERELVTGT